MGVGLGLRPALSVGLAGADAADDGEVGEVGDERTATVAVVDPQAATRRTSASRQCFMAA